MHVRKSENLQVRTEADIVKVRQTVRLWALETKFSLVEQTKIITASSELSRNTLIHGGGGTVQLEIIENDGKEGLRLRFVDQGPGIPDIELAMKDGFTSGGGMGMGLPGAKRLVNEFEIASTPNEGTQITIVKWRGR